MRNVVSCLRGRVARPYFECPAWRPEGARVHVVTSTSAAARVEAARAFIPSHPPASEVVVVGASRGAAEDFARSVARTAGATFGLTRFSLTELVARAAAAHDAGARRVPGTQAGAEAIAARAVFDAVAAAELEYFAPVAAMPGFPKALARTVHELRLAGVGPARVGQVLSASARTDSHASFGGRSDLARLLT